MPKGKEQKENSKRAEDYISNMTRTIMSMSAVLITVCVMILAIIGKWKPSFAKLSVTSCVLIAVVMFIISFWQGVKSHGYLIKATKEGESGYDAAQSPLWKYLKILWTGLIFLGIACLLFFAEILKTYIKLSSIMERITMPAFLPTILDYLSYGVVIIGSIGMICFATKFPLSGRIKDLELESVSARFLGLNGYQVWKWSWILILAGSAIRIIMIFIT